MSLFLECNKKKSPHRHIVHNRITNYGLRTNVCWCAFLVRAHNKFLVNLCALCAKTLQLLRLKNIHPKVSRRFSQRNRRFPQKKLTTAPLSLRGAKRRRYLLLTTITIVIARHAVPKQPPGQPTNSLFHYSPRHHCTTAHLIFQTPHTECVRS